MKETQKCQTCPTVFEYERKTSRRLFCTPCLTVRQMKWAKWSNARIEAAPKRKLIRYAGYDPSDRHT